MPYALWNLEDGKEPSATLVNGAEDAPPETVVIVDALVPGQAWNASESAASLCSYRKKAPPPEIR